MKDAFSLIEGGKITQREIKAPSVEVFKVIEHSPLPWSIFSWGDEEHMCGVSNYECDVAHTGNMTRGERNTDAYYRAREKANAEFITMACNNHYQLVKSLKETIAALESMGGGALRNCTALGRAKETLRALVEE